MRKSEINPNIRLTEGNAVLKDTPTEAFLIFSLPARESCPYATPLCKKICYARGSQEMFNPVYACRKRNYEESLKTTFVIDMIKVLSYQLQRKKYTNKTLYVRIHESGDFYAKDYFDKWVAIAEHFKSEPRLYFQAYTKSLPFLPEDMSQINIKIMYSVLPDTLPENIADARKKGMHLFIALPYEQYLEQEESTRCPGACENCKVCYKENKDMYVEFHGGRLGNVKGRIDHDHTANRSIYGNVGYGIPSKP